MTREERRERGDRLCRALAERIGNTVTPGLGHWWPAWDIVAADSDAYLDALARWEDTGEDPDRAALEAAARGLMSAWREADRSFLDVQAGGRVPA